MLFFREIRRLIWIGCRIKAFWHTSILTQKLLSESLGYGLQPYLEDG